MARIRTIKPEWLEDEQLAACSDTARMLSVALITLADDHGNGRAHPAFLASRVWPYDDDLAAVSRKLAASLGELADASFCVFYTCKKQRYFHICNWSKHQRIDNAGKPKVPTPKEGTLCSADGSPLSSANSPRTSASSPLEEEGKGREEDPDTRASAREGVGSVVTPDRYLAAAAIHAEVTGSKELRVDGQHTPRQTEALRRCLLWARGDLEELRAELVRLRDHGGDWLQAQPIHVWAERLGSPQGASASSARPGPAPVSAAADFEEELTF